MHWLWVILIGLIVGAVAKLLMPGKDPGGFIITILLGIAGSLVGTWLGRAVGWYQERTIRGIHHVGDRRDHTARHLSHGTATDGLSARF
jgi:uncharacterized membrane protein YeaQ/YmgE (transglycosylase-associated protein family)